MNENERLTRLAQELVDNLIWRRDAAKAEGRFDDYLNAVKKLNYMRTIRNYFDQTKQ